MKAAYMAVVEEATRRVVKSVAVEGDPAKMLTVLLKEYGDGFYVDYGEGAPPEVGSVQAPR